MRLPDGMLLACDRYLSTGQLALLLYMREPDGGWAYVTDLTSNAAEGDWDLEHDTFVTDPDRMRWLLDCRPFSLYL